MVPSDRIGTCTRLRLYYAHIPEFDASVFNGGSSGLLYDLLQDARKLDSEQNAVFYS